MISFDEFKADGRLPVYQQILDYIKRGAVAGTIADGDELPSRRVLSARLGINPNTVQKAFALLEDELRGMVRVLNQTGLERDEAAELIRKYWEENEE